MRKLNTFVLGGIVALIACMILMPFLVHAQEPVQDVVAAVCADNGSLIVQAIAWIGGTVGAASLLANFRNKLPPPLVAVLDTLALNFVKALVASRKAAVVFLLVAAAGLAACQNGQLTPQAQNVIGVLCKADQAAPAVVQGTGSVVVMLSPDQAGNVALANDADKLAHPVVQAACASALPGSTPAATVVTPAAAK